MASPLRKQLAAEVLRLPARWLGTTVAKLVEDYKDDLIECTTTGKIPEDLHIMLTDTGEKPKVSTEDIEGVNNSLGSHGRRCPHSSIQLASDRMRIRRCI